MKIARKQTLPSVELATSDLNSLRINQRLYFVKDFSLQSLTALQSTETMKETITLMKLNKTYQTQNAKELMALIASRKGEKMKNDKDCGKLEDITTTALKAQSMITRMMVKKKNDLKLLRNY